jgi:multisubunit Na+/H+ antiporter MnhE subunit
MNSPQNSIKPAVSYFFFILFGSLLASVAGGTFGALVSVISPALVRDLFSAREGSLTGYAFSVGMIWGLFIGMAVSCFSCLLVTILKIIRLRIDHRSQDQERFRG